MSKETLKYKAEIALTNYMVVFILLILVAFLARSLGNSIELLLLKLAVVPLFFLSFGGLKAIYRHPIVEHRVTLRAVEYTVLDGLLFSLFIFVILWKSDEGPTELFIRFGSLVIIFTALKLGFLFFEVRRIARSHLVLSRQLISSGSEFENVIGYSRAVVDGDYIFVSGTTGYNYQNMEISDSVIEQADQCFTNIQKALEEAGASVKNIVRVTYIFSDRVTSTIKLTH